MDFRIFGPENQKTKLETKTPETGSSVTAQSLVPRQLQIMFKKLGSPFSDKTKMDDVNRQEGAN